MILRLEKPGAGSLMKALLIVLLTSAEAETRIQKLLQTIDWILALLFV